MGAPTYGYLHGQHVTVNMTEAVFESVEPGVRHVMKVVVKNISMRGQRVRLVAPRETEFALTVQNDVDLAPGLEMTAELAYYAEEPADIESTLYVLVGRADARPKADGEGEQIPIPVRATLPGAKIAFNPTVAFGVVTPGQHAMRELVITNTGSREGRCAFGAP
jgi:phage baseplate assembly protein W